MQRRLPVLTVATLAVAGLVAPASAAWTSSAAGSGSSTALTLSAPGAPSSSSATTSSVSLSWSGVTFSGGAVRYHVQRQSGAAWVDACGSTAGSPLTATSCTDAGLSASTTYTYRVASVFSAWNTIGTTSTATTATPPPAPSGLALAAGSDSGLSNSDRITNVTQPTFTGTGATAGATIKLLVGTVEVGSTIAQSDGTFTVTVAGDKALADGAHTMTATQTTSAGTSPTSGSVSVTVDTRVSAPTVTAPSGTGTSRDPSYSGTAGEAGGSVSVQVVVRGTATPIVYSATTAQAPSGSPTVTWNIAARGGKPEPLSNNTEYSVTAVHTDIAGNVSAPSAASTFKT